MRKLTLILSALAILCCPLSAAAQGDFPSIDAFLKSTLKGDAQLSVGAKGDLNDDRLEDWAGLIRREKTDSSPTYQLFVLVGMRQGGYRVAVNTKEEEIAGMGCCWVESMEISRASIFIQSNAKDASTMEAATHQFKFYKGVWRLVGKKIYLTDFTPDAPATMDTDINLLTGLVVEKEQKGENKPTIKRRHKKFSTYLLKDFDFSNGFGTTE